ncbi:XRE family transcriptional regulator [Streptococcus sp. X16XC17]|uniref:helix-turn-helix domain-containing protein n=1 Tax=unclassified Streptococcus TaxID=2608887 RepID=UPI00066FF624|nr:MULTISPECIES: helix-turn-helix transcriptional regulator [unclassified Streptococcus]TCD45552.1 XRE family transcriptional regulator [Streptococcus sp. X16XC17]
MQTIGEKIKVLRREAGLNQQQLANKLGLSNQAISKWETNATQPEITLLPDIATAFGVSIDELFDYTTEKYLDKIESRLDSGQSLPLQEIANYERFLQDLTQPDQTLRKSELLAYLYFRCGEDFMDKANAISKKVLLDKPNDKSSLSIISRASKGYLFDWNQRNHTELIDYYITTLEQDPRQTAIYLYLLDNLLDDWRVEEAKTWLEKASKTGSHP